MFARTPRLMLRPGWIEDAPELAQRIADPAVVRNLSRAPWPYALGDAEAFLSQPRGKADGSMLIHALEGGGARLVGGIGIGPLGDERWELGYWIASDAWGRGYASEAGRAVVRAARESLRIARLTAGHFADNPASGRVLRKLGFRPTGAVVPMHSKARGGSAPCVRYELDLLASGSGDADCRMAA